MWTQYNAAGQINTGAINTEYAISYSVTSGATDPGPATMGLGNVLIVWQSTSGVNKFQTIPASTGSKNKITIADGVTPSGSAGSFSIFIQPSAGTLIGSGVVNIINVNLNSITLADSPVGWIAI